MPPIVRLRLMRSALLQGRILAFLRLSLWIA